MKEQRKLLISAALGLGLLSAMLLLSSLNTFAGKAPRKNIVLKDVRMYVPPPPPPKSPDIPKRSNSAVSGGSLKIDDVLQPIELGRMKLDTRFANASSVPVVNGLGGVGLAGFGGTTDGPGGIVEVLTADQLDATPMVMNSPLMPFPEQFVKKNIKQYQVVFQIMIDENGKAFPIRVVQSPAPELNAQFMEFAKNVTFTPPRRKGTKVKAYYLWPVLFNRK